MLNLNHSSFYRKFPAFSLGAEINQLAQPLFNSINANYFDYNRIYPNNGFLSLASDTHWLEHFFKQHYKIGTAIVQSGIHLWDYYYYQKPIQVAKEAFNHAHGITIIYKRQNYIEYIDIAASNIHREIVSIYLNNFNLIEAFIQDFIEKAAPLISLAEAELVKLPSDVTENITNDLLQPDDCYLLQKFKLTRREYQCLENYFKGSTAKETARILNLSYRTVEEHFNNLKRKLNCQHKRDLLKFRL